MIVFNFIVVIFTSNVNIFILTKTKKKWYVDIYTVKSYLHHPRFLSNLTKLIITYKLKSTTQDLLDLI
jgi:hypothetical protein